MHNLRLFNRSVERGAVEGVRYGHNQYGPFESLRIWEKGSFAGGVIPMRDFLNTLSSLWQSMTPLERLSWSSLSSKNRTSCYAEFTRWNVRLLIDDLSPVKTPI